MSKLVVVESPAKAKTIKKYLGKDFEVKASVGHIIDLPKNSMGVDLESGDFTPEYAPIMGKGKIIKEIQAAAKKADVVYLAPDPDREGEAIAHHLAELIKNGPKKKGSKGPQILRVRFNEITKTAIKKAFEAAGEIDHNLFDAQQARRVLDRVVGYKISPVLWKKVKRGLSAGRVQSVAVRMVVEREKAIRIFKPVEYWSMEAKGEVASKPPPFLLKLLKLAEKKAELGNKLEAEAVLEILDREGRKGKVTGIKKSERKRRPGPPFITSKLQQDAARAFRYTAKRTMGLAQHLYEGVEMGEDGHAGLITYMRTDSARVSDDALFMVREHIGKKFGKEFLPKDPNVFKGKKGAQDAHEAIRPTSMAHTPEKVKAFVTKDHYKLYKLIWDRFVASQMMPAVYDRTQVDVTAGIVLLRATGSIMRFEGFLKAYKEQLDEDDQGAKTEASEEGVILPDLAEGDEVKLKDIKTDQHFTQPPPRFSEASLIKELEEQGIGRPSTYAAIMSTIQDKGYAEKQESRFHPTELGEVVTDLLVESFPTILNMKFTAEMEANLDQIEEGKRGYKQTLAEFYAPFTIALKEAQENMRDVKRMEEVTDVKCEKCSSHMVIKWGKNGSFLGCSAYPKCSSTRPYKKVDGKIVPLKQETIDRKCPTCGGELQVKRARYGKFVGCSRYPDCSFTMPMPIDVPCPKEGCDGEVVEKQGRNRRIFYGCLKYPGCDFVSWDRPIAKPCEVCQNPFLVKKESKAGTKILCPKCKADFSED